MAAILANETEFKRAMEDIDDSFANLLTPANVAIPDTYADEVNYRPAAQQWTVRTP